MKTGAEVKNDELVQKLASQFQLFKENDPPFNKIAKEYSTHAFWALAEEQCPDLSELVLSVIKISSNEAPTERSFSHQKKVHGPDRPNLSHKQVEAEVFIRMNYEKTCPKIGKKLRTE